MQPRPPHGERDGGASDYVGRRRPAQDHPAQYHDGHPADFLYGPSVASDERPHDEHPYNEHAYDQHDHIYGDGEIYRSPAKRRRRTLIGALSFVIVAILAVGGFVVIRDVIGRLGGGSEDYSGSGGDAVTVVIDSGATISDIAATLEDADVVASTDAFLDAAKDDPAATSIQPGAYELRSKMSAASALAMLLDPATRNVAKLVIPEGYRVDQVVAAISEQLKIPLDEVSAAAADVSKLGIPAGFEGATSIEGMLFPATYDFGPSTTALQALQAMTAKFSSVVASTGFVAKAKAQGVSPYDALKVASMAEAEATNAADWAKVSRVIYNRVQQGQPLGIDSTSVYEARLNGQDPMTIDYKVDTPYNTRRTVGFPPTPIGNPGEATLRAAVGPAQGNWLYYVQSDAAGTLTFTDDFAEFSDLADLCIQNSWGNC